MNLSCPNCNQKANTKSPEFFKEALIECSACGTHYHVEGHVVNISDRSYKQVAQAPKGIQIENQINSKVITIDSEFQRSWMSILFGLFFIGVVGFQFFQIPQLLSFGWHLIPLALFGIIGILQVVKSFRKRIIHISPKELKITHSIPGFFLKDKIFPLTDFTQFYTKKIITKNNETSVVRFSLQGILKNGAGEVGILGGFMEADQVYFLEREIETMLDIRDVKVNEEYDNRSAIKMTFGKAYQLMKAVRRNNKESEI